MRIIKGEGQRKFMKQQILAAVSMGNNLIDDSASSFARLLRSNTVHGRFLRRLLNPPPPPQLTRRRRSK